MDAVPIKSITHIRDAVPISDFNQVSGSQSVFGIPDPDPEELK
jgi:hypothetical protein